MNKENRNRVLVCPLGWGLGHASRLIPIIERFQKSGDTIIIAGDELQILYLKEFFPDIKTLNFPSFKVKLAKGSNQLIPILGIAIRLPYHTLREHFVLKGIVKKHRINLIISDNRYGLWCKGIKSILITHQLSVLFPKPFKFIGPVGAWFIRKISRKFSFCWIPDYPGVNNLAGDLSHLPILPLNARYVGLLSRFQKLSLKVNTQEWDLVGIASGPSPQREILIDLISNLARINNLKALIIKGNPSEGTKVIEKGGIFYAGHLNDVDFQRAIQSSKYLITRAGYSTIMDLAAIGIAGLIVPTPGQTEQEYLANYLSSRGIFKSCKQYELEKIGIAIALVNPIYTETTPQLLEKAINELIIIK